MIVKVENLKPGNIVDQWDLDRGDGSIVAKVEVKQRPGYRWTNVFVTMKNGRRIQYLEGAKVHRVKGL